MCSIVMAIAFGKQFDEELIDWEAKCDWVDGECSVICIMYVELCVYTWHESRKGACF